MVFSNLNLILKQSNIIIGPSGIGKTTLLSLLIQKYVPFKGKILINNEIGLDNISYEFWQKNVFIYIQILLFITVQF
ncbi:ATP-binding cassette domain-containing protein [Spiroplasma endosymbiont of Villa modesta]|uniref:ATP-binding cassette domain-containing protein n=1 Tax=Spiroplasma endosymbiont of Villa modesta TaxID=3066293 RepID=UPI003CC79E91